MRRNPKFKSILFMLAVVFSVGLSRAQTLVDMAVSEEYFFLLTSSGDLHTGFIGVNGTPYFTSTVSIGEAGKELALTGDLLYAALGEAGIAVIDISTPDTPGLVATVADSTADKIAASGDTVYFNDYPTMVLTARNLVDPAEPVELGNRTGTSLVRDIALLGRENPVVGSLAGVEVLDIPDGDTMAVLGVYGDERGDQLLISEELCYVATQAVEEVYFSVLDLGDPTNPELLGQDSQAQGGTIYLNDLDYHDMVAGDGVVYVGYDYTGSIDDEEYGFWVFDVSNPSNPTPGETEIFDTAIDCMGIVRGYLVVFCNDLAYTFDISSPTEPVLLSSTDSPEPKLLLPGAFELGAAYPNPFNPSTMIPVNLHTTGGMELKVFNLSGQEVALLHSGTLPAGAHRFLFRGDGLASGIYFVRAVDAAGSLQTRRIVLTR